MKKLLTSILLFTIIITSACSKNMINSGTITCTQFNKVINYNNVKIIDVRNDDEYNEGHLDNAINIPYDNIVEGIKAYNDISKDTPIVLYCKSGARSEKAYNSLKNEGYKHLYNLGAMKKC